MRSIYVAFVHSYSIFLRDVTGHEGLEVDLKSMSTLIRSAQPISFALHVCSFGTNLAAATFCSYTRRCEARLYRSF